MEETIDVNTLTRREQEYPEFTHVWYKDWIDCGDGSHFFLADEDDARRLARARHWERTAIVVPYNANHLDFMSSKHYDDRGKRYQSISISPWMSKQITALNAPPSTRGGPLTLAQFCNLQRLEREQRWSAMAEVCWLPAPATSSRRP